jgi:CRISPR-associated endonuclease Cas1
MRDSIVAHTRKIVEAWQESSNESVLIADGAGIKITVSSGHLLVSDGIAGARRVRKIARIDKQIRRLMILSPSGYISLDAISWMRDAGINWCQISQTRGILAQSGPGVQDSRLLRAQARAIDQPEGLAITKYLLTQKLTGQAGNIDRYFPGTSATFIRGRSATLAEADSIHGCTVHEGLASEAHWRAWEGKVPVPFTTADQAKIPGHWRGFTQRHSLAYSVIRNKSATDPVNACLNYLYGIALAECVSACHETGLSPSLGICHVDKNNRDSMALDLLEVLRPACERIVLDLFLSGEKFDRRYVHETPDGTVLLVQPLTHKLGSHAVGLAEILAPHVAHVVSLLVAASPRMTSAPRYKSRNRTPKPTRHVGYPAARLRPGVTVTDLVPDHVWVRIALLIPERGRNGRPPVLTDRAAVAALAARYVVKCPWRQVPGGVHRSTVTARLSAWQADGTWEKVAEILRNEGHLSTLTSL